MTLLEWLWGWRNKAAPVPDYESSVTPSRRPKAAVPAEWLSLYTYLEDRYASNVVLTFGQMEALLGRALPDAARTEHDWWTDRGPHTGRCSSAWTAARRTATPNLLAGTVAFERLP